MLTLNQCNFELISLELDLNQSVGFPGMTSTVNQSSEWHEGISTFGELHCKKLKQLRITGNEHIFPIASFMRLGLPVKHEFHIELIGNYDREILIKLVIPVK